MRWPWGQNEKDREVAFERAEAALREMTSAFTEAEVASRRVDFYLSEIRRLLEDGFGLHRASLAPTLASGDRVESGYDLAFTEYFEVLDSLTPLSRHSTARKLAHAAETFTDWTDGFQESLEAYAETKRDLDYLFDVIADNRTACLPLSVAATESLDAARAELAALSADGISSKPLRRRLQETGQSLKVLKNGSTDTARRLEVAAYFRRLHAEAEDVRRRIRLARPLVTAFEKTLAG